MTLFVIAWHTEWETYILVPKLPGLQTVKVATVADGKRQANRMYVDFVGFLLGEVEKLTL